MIDKLTYNAILKSLNNTLKNRDLAISTIRFSTEDEANVYQLALQHEFKDAELKVIQSSDKFDWAIVASTTHDLPEQF